VSELTFQKARTPDAQETPNVGGYSVRSETDNSGRLVGSIDRKYLIGAHESRGEGVVLIAETHSIRDACVDFAGCQECVERPSRASEWR